VELPLTEICCGSAGIYNITQTKLALQLLESKMQAVNSTGAETIATANPGCMLQLRAGARMYGTGQRVAHVVELLDEALPRSTPLPP
jgi:glycolate oxidase iron-sulfur subunit